jgi:hypothetical protein
MQPALQSDTTDNNTLHHQISPQSPSPSTANFPICKSNPIPRTHARRLLHQTYQRRRLASSTTAGGNAGARHGSLHALTGSSAGGGCLRVADPGRPWGPAGHAAQPGLQHVQRHARVRLPPRPQLHICRPARQPLSWRRLRHRSGAARRRPGVCDGAVPPVRRGPRLRRLLRHGRRAPPRFVRRRQRRPCHIRRLRDPLRERGLLRPGHAPGKHTALQRVRRGRRRLRRRGAGSGGRPRGGRASRPGVRRGGRKGRRVRGGAVRGDGRGGWLRAVPQGGGGEHRRVPAQLRWPCRGRRLLHEILP